MIAPNTGLRCREHLETILHCWPNDEGDNKDNEVADHQVGLVKSEKHKGNRQNLDVVVVVSGVGRGLVRWRNYGLWLLNRQCKRDWGGYSCFFGIERCKGIRIRVGR